MPIKIEGTTEQIERAEDRYKRHLKACRSLGILPEHKSSIIDECITNDKALEDLEKMEWTNENIADGVVQQRYHQYESPRQ